MARKEIEVTVECSEKPTQEMLNRVYAAFYEGRRKATSPVPETQRPHSSSRETD